MDLTLSDIKRYNIKKNPDTKPVIKDNNDKKNYINNDVKKLQYKHLQHIRKAMLKKHISKQSKIDNVLGILHKDNSINIFKDDVFNTINKHSVDNSADNAVDNGVDNSVDNGADDSIDNDDGCHIEKPVKPTTWAKLSIEERQKLIIDYFDTLDDNSFVNKSEILSSILTMLQTGQLNNTSIVDYDKVNRRISRFKNFEVNDDGKIIIMNKDTVEEKHKQYKNHVKKTIKHIYKLK